MGGEILLIGLIVMIMVMVFGVMNLLLIIVFGNLFDMLFDFIVCVFMDMVLMDVIKVFFNDLIG